MALDIRYSNVGTTADAIDLCSVLLANSTTSQESTISYHFGIPTSEELPTRMEKSHRSHTENAIEATDREIISIFLEIEPKYSRTNRMLADM